MDIESVVVMMLLMKSIPIMNWYIASHASRKLYLTTADQSSYYIMYRMLV